MRELIEQIRDLANQALAGLPADSPASTAASPAKTTPQGQPAPGNTISDGLDTAKILTVVGLAEQEAEKLSDSGANVTALLRKLQDIRGSRGKRRVVSDAITTGIGEAQLLHDDGGFDTSALMAHLSTINEIVGSGGATIGGTDVMGDMEGEGTVK